MIITYRKNDDWDIVIFYIKHTTEENIDGDLIESYLEENINEYKIDIIDLDIQPTDDAWTHRVTVKYAIIEE